MTFRPKTKYAFFALAALAFFGAFSVSIARAQLLGNNPYQGGSPLQGNSPSYAKEPGVGGSPKNQAVSVGTGTASVGKTSQVSLSGYCSGFTANVATGTTKLSDLFKYFTCMIQRMILPLLMALGGLFFVIGMVKFITSSQGEERAEGRQFMIWGIVGFAVIFSLWGILTIFKQTFNLQNAAPVIPTTPPAKIQ